MLMWNGVTHIGSDWVFRVRSRCFSSVIFWKRLSWHHTLHSSPKNGISKCWRGNRHDCKTMLTFSNSFSPILLSQNRDYQHVPYSGYYKFLEPAVNLNDPELIKDVLIKDHFSFHVNEIRFDEKADPLMSLNPFGATHDTWRKARNVLTPLLTLFRVTLTISLAFPFEKWQWKTHPVRLRSNHIFCYDFCLNMHRFVHYIHCLWIVA